MKCYNKLATLLLKNKKKLVSNNVEKTDLLFEEEGHLGQLSNSLSNLFKLFEWAANFGDSSPRIKIRRGVHPGS